MGDTIQIKVDESLSIALEKIRKSVAEEIKQKYSLDEIQIYGTVASQILAAHYLKKEEIHFTIKKINNKKGILQLDY